MSACAFDFPEVSVGTAIDPKGPTGTTVLKVETGALGCALVQGGAASTYDLSALEPGNTWSEIDAVVFSGGSSVGHGAAAGVAQALFEEWGGAGTDEVPGVVGAVVNDFAGRDSTVVPTAALGKRALKYAESKKIPMGRVGAGINCRVGTFFDDANGMFGAQGAHFTTVRGVKLLALVVANSLGDIFTPDGTFVAGDRRYLEDKRSIVDRVLFPGPGGGRRPSSQNTTLTALVTNAALDRQQLLRVATMVHASLAQCIRPYASPEDGDVVFVLSTQTQRLPRALEDGAFGIHAGRAVQDALVAGLKAANPLP